ncbi:helix-turn-helix domain-containing protein [Polaromonas hydrogenivorans]|uniref:Helix-turn-helix domain-containing protein n=1 Tax=Polaromonas hydrogenivorans TaxID=335476 RepID=A0AAU7LYC5_9BURK
MSIDLTPCKRLVDSHQKFLDALPGTTMEIMQKAGISYSTVYKCQRHYRAFGEVHIAGYKANGGTPSPIYVRGPGQDALPKNQSAKPATPIKPRPSKREKRAARLAMEQINARIAARAAPRTPRTTDVALSRSRLVFPLSGAWS